MYLNPRIQCIINEHKQIIGNTDIKLQDWYKLLKAYKNNVVSCEIAIAANVAVQAAYVANIEAKNAINKSKIHTRCQETVTDCDIQVKVLSNVGPNVDVVLDSAYNQIECIHNTVKRAYQNIGLIYPDNMIYENIHGVNLEGGWLDSGQRRLNNGDIIYSTRYNNLDELKVNNENGDY